MSVSLLLGLVYLISELLLPVTRRSRRRTETKHDWSTLRVGFFQAKRVPLQLLQFMHRKRLTMDAG
jgi:hypothetical protein